MHISDAPLFSPLLSGLNVNICPPRGTDMSKKTVLKVLHSDDLSDHYNGPGMLF